MAGTHYSKKVNETMKKEKGSPIGIGEQLRRVREENGYSQEELAKALNLTRPTITRWENGATPVKVEHAVTLAKLYGCTLDYLILGSKSENHDIYATTGLIDSAVAMLSELSEMEQMLFNDDSPGPLRILNQAMSDEDFYSLFYDLANLRTKWKEQQIRIAELELTKQKTKSNKKEYINATNELAQLEDEREFMMWKYLRMVDILVRKILVK